MYTATLALHSWLRWVALGLIFASVVIAALKNNGPRAKRLSLLTMISFDVQTVLGLLLYLVLSPITTGAFGNFGATMKDSVARFWAVEHLTGMVFALALVHIGHARGKRAADDAKAARNRLIFYGAALLVTFALIPWPFRAAGRGLFFFG